MVKNPFSLMDLMVMRLAILLLGCLAFILVARLVGIARRHLARLTAARAGVAMEGVVWLLRVAAIATVVVIGVNVVRNVTDAMSGHPPTVTASAR